MKSRSIWNCAAVAVAISCLWLAGCGSSSGANVVTVSVVSSVGNAIILGESTTLTATVTGGTSTNTMVNWQACQFTTTTVSGTTTTTTKPAACPTDGTLGTISNQLATGTATYTAPNKVPNQTTFPGLAIVITAQAQSDTSKSGSATLTLDSGISVTLTPNTASVPTKEQQQFTSILTNDLQSQGVVWLVTQSVPTATITVPNLATCSPTCGTITSSGLNEGIYTAPATVPTAVTPSTSTSTTPAIVTVVATAKGDNTRFVTGTITITTGGPITFNGISPTIAPQGATYWDVYLDAPNISSSSIITLTDQNGGTKTFTSLSNQTAFGSQVKVLFPIPTSTTTAPSSIGARLRLLEGDLQGANTGTPLTYTVSVTDPAEPVTKTAGGKFSLTLLPVRPSVISATPTGVVQGATTSAVPMNIDGGYFGPGGDFANVAFQTTGIPKGATSNSRQLAAQFPTSAISLPGLYPLSVSRSASPTPPTNNPAVTTLAVFPDYSINPPLIGAPIPAGTNPSAIDIDTTLGIAVVAETGSNAIQFFNIGSGSLTPLACPVASCAINMPTGLSVNPKNHTVAVVSYQDQSVQVFPFPNTTPPTGIPFTTPIALGSLLPGVSSPPIAYSIGVDPETNLALVAFSSTSLTSSANVGFVVNLNVGNNPPFGCLATLASQGPCVYSQVTLNNGQYPQVAMAPNHLAFVSPGGSGNVRGVDVRTPSTSVGISSVSLTSGIVTVQTTADLTGIVPGIPTTVFIKDVPTTNAAGNTNFNGVFSIADISNNTFSYALNSTNSGSFTAGSGSTVGTVFYGSPNLIFSGISTSAQGIAINPITRTAVFADPGQGAASISLLNQLDQSVSNMTFSDDCTFFYTGCPSNTEPLGTTSVAWQPYTNSIVSYNPGTATVQANQVSISDPVTLRRYAFACLSTQAPCITNPLLTDSAQQQHYLAQITLPGTGFATLSPTLTLTGGIAVDPATNQAFVVESGSSTIQVINLGPTAGNAMKLTQISEIRVTNAPPAPLTCPAGSVSGVPNAFAPEATLTSATDMCGVEIFGSNLLAGSQVRLDGTSLPPSNVQPITNANNQGANRGLFVTIPASFLTAPHHYVLDVVTPAGDQSNPTDFFVVQAVDMSVACSGPVTPSSVAIADQLANGPFSPIAVVTNSGCNSISTVDINPTVTVNGVVQPNPTFGHILHSIAVGTTPQGIAVSAHLGLAVVANNGSGNASIVNLLTNTQPVAAVAVGTNPIGVAINDATGAALVANFGSNSVSEIDLASLSGSTSLTALTIGGVQQPIAVAIDPDRGTNNQGLALVTGLPLSNGALPSGALYPVDIGLVSPGLSTTISLGSVSSTPTGIVFNPAVPLGAAPAVPPGVAPQVTTNTGNPGLFYVNSSGGNIISSFNPDSGTPSQASVGINPTALAINPQTGAVLTSNFAGKSVSIVDSLSNPMKTRLTIGLPGSAQFGVAIDQFTNLAVIVDQANNRLLLFPMPN
jgi:DNA-binding beta-propeller fold protein YncE